MREILAIFRKDWRRLWPLVLLFFNLLALSAWVDPAYSTHPLKAGFGMLTFLILLTAGSLIVSAIQQEALPGDCQYWLTRPIARHTLIAAKGVFVLVAVLLPVVVVQLILYVALGLPLAEHLPTLLGREAYFIAYVILPVAALASITRSAGQFILVIVALLTVVIAMGSSEIVRWWIPVPLSYLARFVAIAAICCLGAAAILYRQYTRRDTVPSALVVAASGLLMVLFVRAEAPPSVKPASFQLQLAAADTPAPPAPPRSAQLPVRIVGIPDGMDITVDSAEVDIVERSGGGALGFSRFLHCDLRREGRDRAWLTISDPREALAGGSVGDVSLRAAVTVILSKPVASYPASSAQTIMIPGFGGCRDEVDKSGPRVQCYSPRPQTSLAVQEPTGHLQWIFKDFDSHLVPPSAYGFQTIDRYSAATTPGARLVSATGLELKRATLDLPTSVMGTLHPPAR